MTTVAPHTLADPEPIGWSRQQVQSFASEVAQDLGYKPGSDLEDLVAGLGGRIVYADLESVRDTGSIDVRGPEDFTISLSPFAGGRRTRFTIAHELGHYILHSQLGLKPIRVRRDGSDRVEWEANWFAAGFLMPEAEFKRKVRAGFTNAMLAEHFDVSEAAVEIRRSSL